MLVSCCASRIIASYIYQDGEAFVRASVAMDAIVQAVEARRAVPTALAYIDTPTHVHVVPSNCAETSSRYYEDRSGWQKALQLIPGAGLLQPVVYSDAPKGTSGGCPWGVSPSVTNPHHASPGTFLTCSFCRQTILSSVSMAQGPNYAIAKLIQRWRIMVSTYTATTPNNLKVSFERSLVATVQHARSSKTRKYKQLVSANVAPGARTYSVMHAAQVGAALEQIHHFAPNEFYDPATVCAVMAGLLVRDVTTQAVSTVPRYTRTVCGWPHL